MSGSLPHSIALSNLTLTNTTTPGYTTYDVRSDEDTGIAALNARNAKASSDLVVTLSEEGQALSQHKKPPAETSEFDENQTSLKTSEERVLDNESNEIILEPRKDSMTTSYHDKIPTGDFLNQIV
ncbi:hypothetical protein [Marinomonas sp. IMCC 4694]|uniref:hypothetical protein n=1 Tax=Marinomonas sp. IMCC 4694 TaxID=2605432 RepID=UPI0011E77520|nr:hypothetical protein [Marinomonas sp. IMCC 4694]TYL47915.1 hypothetical protein FXV75_08185 [Marinomonas sp. IMCC 4694]